MTGAGCGWCNAGARVGALVQISLQVVWVGAQEWVQEWMRWVQVYRYRCACR